MIPTVKNKKKIASLLPANMYLFLEEIGRFTTKNHKKKIFLTRNAKYRPEFKPND